MTPLAWTPALELRQPRMDATHREFVDLLAEVAQALPNAPADAGRALDRLIEHTVEHFAQEERWMSALGFQPDNCHSTQHTQVLEVMREVRRRSAAADDLEARALLEPLAEGLAQWFPMHAQMMDAALAMVMAEAGFDPDRPTAPRASTAAAISGCGSAGCSG